MHNCSNPNYIHVTHAHSLPSNDVASNTMYYQRQYRTTLVALTKTYYVTMYTTNEHDVLLEHTHEPPRAITILHCSSKWISLIPLYSPLSFVPQKCKNSVCCFLNMIPQIYIYGSANSRWFVFLLRIFGQHWQIYPSCYFFR